MPRDIPVSNGSLLVSFDKDYQLRELFFPHIGEETHTRGEPFRFGVWCNGQFKWSTDGWKINQGYLDDSLVTKVELTHDALGIKIIANDLVDFHENIYLKKLEVENLSKEKKEIRLFLAHDFHISSIEIGDTAAFRPEVNGILHYKNNRYFLINIKANNKYGVDLYATGNKEIAGYQGSWVDAEDGVLSGNPIAQGAVDSVIGIPMILEPGAKESCYYWICAGQNWDEVKELNETVIKKTPEVILKRTFDYWHLWIGCSKINFDAFPEKIRERVKLLYLKSLLICRTQIDNAGGIMAGNDSDVINFNRDTYSYMWPRDGALTAYALDLADYPTLTRNFFNFCVKLLTKEGYFLHKYTPTGSLASSWHSYVQDHKAQIPLQEDETALVIWSLWNHFKMYHEVEFIKPLYRPLIKKAADFLVSYHDHKTGLPLPSFDLWEERQGILTYTVAAVYGGLTAAANFVEAFGETDLAQEYREGAKSIRAAMDKYLYLEKEKRFARMINFKKDGTIEVDSTIDASLYGVFAFGAYPADDERVKNTMQQVKDKLWCKTNSGGIARYENDNYYRTSNDIPGNPWFVTTLWMAQYAIAKAKNKEELQEALPYIEWACDHALPSGVMAEQVNPHTKEPVSVSPLTWSHGTFIATVREYMNKFKAL